MKQYPKIDIFIGTNGHWQYVASTTWSKTLKEAKALYFATRQGVHIDNIKCSFDRIVR